jgi:hypothetical protein
MVDLSPDLLEGAANQIARTARESSESDDAETCLLWGQEDALDSVLYALTREHYAAELQALSDREAELEEREDAIREERRLVGLLEGFDV